LQKPPTLNRAMLILLAPNAKNATPSSNNNYFAFQYNPEKLLHTFNQGMPQATAGYSTPDVAEPPVEQFNLTFDLDSVDPNPPIQDQIAAEFGVHPALAMLELMMQPQVISGKAVMPVVVFKWGTNRSVPVRIVGMNVEEKTFNPTLNPTTATVTLTLRVLTASEVATNAGAKSAYTSYQNAQATLVDKYRTQTGQGSPGDVGVAAGASAAVGSAVASGSVAAASGVLKSKTKIQQATKASKRTYA